MSATCDKHKLLWIKIKSLDAKSISGLRAQTVRSYAQCKCVRKCAAVTSYICMCV